MVVEYHYTTVSGALRWNLGWQTPNYAGAFVASLLPLAWFAGLIRRPGPAKVIAAGAAALEAAGWFLLCKTQSRGALVAAVAALAFWHLAMGFRRTWRLLALRTAFAAVCVCVAGFFGRLTPRYVTEDSSVGNRMEVWRGSLEMMAAAPMTGWGPGKSGEAYSRWFQPIDRSESYATPVNSYLYLGVERGIPVLALALFAFGLLLGGAWKTARTEGADGASAIAAAAGAALASWAVASLFSTLWVEPRLWAVPSIATVVIILTARRNLLGRSILAGAGLSSCALVAAALLAGALCLNRLPIRPSRLGPGVTALLRRGAGRGPACHLWPDERVLGVFYGKEIRRWLARPGAPPKIVVHEPGATAVVPPSAGDWAVLLGRQAGRLDRGFRGYSKVVLVHPDCCPPDSIPGSGPRIAVVLPEVDQVGGGDLWRQWTGSSGAAEVVSPGVGQDIRKDWPAVLGNPAITGSVP